MRGTRRNHYRTLLVQPEAPAEIIAASYRALVQKLAEHPAREDDAGTAAVLDRAYAVLSDPEQRRRYDAELRRHGRLHPAARGQAGSAALRAAARAAAAALRRSKAAGPGQVGSGGADRADRDQCAWCGEPLPPLLRPDSRCRRCESALSPLQHAGSRHDLFGRRHAQRVLRSASVALFTQWGRPACGARLRDLSMSGFSVLLDRRIAEGQRVRINDTRMDLIAEVVACRKDGRQWVVHARTTHLVFVRRSGALQSTST